MAAAAMKRLVILATLGAISTAAFAGEGGAKNPVADVPLSSLSATRDRPLFAPTRRPPPPVETPRPAEAAPVAQPSTVPAPVLKLVGTVIGPSDRVAIVVENARPAARLRVGDAIAGWRLRSISARGVTLEADGRTLALELHVVGGAAAFVAPAPDTVGANDVADPAGASGKP